MRLFTDHFVRAMLKELFCWQVRFSNGLFHANATLDGFIFIDIAKHCAIDNHMHSNYKRGRRIVRDAPLCMHIIFLVEVLYI